MHFLGFCDRFGSAAGVELCQYVRNVGFDSAGRDEEPFGDLLIGKPGRNELENLEFAAGNTEFPDRGLITDEWTGNRDFYDLWPCKPETSPDAEAGKHNGYEADIKFKRNVPDEIAVFDDLQYSDQDRHCDTVDYDRPPHLQLEIIKAASKPIAANSILLAETTGFEPVVPFWSTTV